MNLEDHLDGGKDISSNDFIYSASYDSLTNSLQIIYHCDLDECQRKYVIKNLETSSEKFLFFD